MESGKILGQEHIIRHFENAIQTGKISHAYIISGEEGTGKLKLARSFAKALQCEENCPDMGSLGNVFDASQKEPNKKITGKACGHCKSCRQTDSLSQPDIKYITHEKAGIGVDEIRDQINNDIDIKPYSSRYKIYIIPESEKMTVQAQNALLKTIEEPPAYVIIILLTTNADIFLQTILSRCVILNIRPVKEESIKNQLMTEYGINEYSARMAAVFSGGNPGKALRQATSEEFKELKDRLIDILQSLETSGMDVISSSVKQIAELKKQAEDYFYLLRLWFRDTLIYKATGRKEQLIFQDNYKAIESQAKNCSYLDINMILQSIDQAQNQIKANVNFDSVMEVLFLTIKERIQG